ncbi:MAG: murein biosynthesis integral membrane protein MurJ [Kofleriaceae bacterium]
MGAGIFLSRIAGLVRERVISFYLGLSPAADAFNAALRIPNVLQNLLGEGVLSASFIPVYARLRAEGREDDARRVARTVGTLLLLVASLVSLAGVVAADPLVTLLAPGFPDAKRELTVAMVQILFPGMTLLVMSAWCLGVLNSHKRFFLSYVSPVLWNTAIIATAIVAGRRFAGHTEDIAVWLAWGAVIGSGAQFLVQLPLALRLVGSAKPALATKDEGVRATVRAFGTVLVGRGSVQISGYIDGILASFLGLGIVAALAKAQILYMLPVSLFGMAISAAELPAMSSTTGSDEERAKKLHERLGPALRRVVFLVVPSAVAFIAIGNAIIALLFQTGRFDAKDTEVVWIVLAGSAIGLSAGTQGRLLASAFYALGDPKPPLRAALVRVALTAGLGYAFSLPIREAAGYSPMWGAFGLTASAGFAAWVEFLLLERWLTRRIGKVAIPTKLGVVALAIAGLGGAAGFGVQHAAIELGLRTWMAALAAIGTFGVIYLAGMALARVPEASAFVRRALRRR